MRTNHDRHSTLAVLAGVALACFANWGWAQDFIIHRFDDASELSTWSRLWGAPPQDISWDSAVDAGGGATLGSMKITVDFNVTSHATDNQMSIGKYPISDPLPLSLLPYKALEMDLMWGAGSPKNPFGNYGKFEYGVRFTDWSDNAFGKTNLTVTNSWIHLVAPINPAMPKIDQVNSLILKLYGKGVGSDLTGKTTFWVDNIILRATADSIPAPRMTLDPVRARGLTIVASATGQSPQQSIRTANAENNTYSWIGRGTTPVTYSFTIASFPGTNHPGFEANIYLVPQAGMLNGDPSGNGRIQWDSAHCVWINVVRNSDDSATAHFIYKTNQPVNNAMFDTPEGRLGNVTSTYGPLGTWSVTFLNDTNIILTAPSGDSSNFFLPAAAAALFTDPLFAYFEARPNNPSASLNTGQYATFSRIQIQGVATPLDDHFPGPGINPDPNNLIWVVLAEDPAGIAVVRADDLYWLGWSLPASGFTLQANTLLKPTTWFDPGFTNPVNFGNGRAVLISKDDLPGPNASFFRMIKP